MADMYITYKAGECLCSSREYEALAKQQADIMTREVFSCVDDTKHKQKPTGAAIGSVSKSLERAPFKAWRVCDLAAALSNGQTVLAGDCGGTRRLEDWQNQQLWFVDIDNDEASAARGYDPLTSNDAVRRCGYLGLPLILSYPTFSSPDDPDANERFRLVFASKEVIKDKTKAQAFGAALLAAFPECDPSTSEGNRLFFGTNKEVTLWLNIALTNRE